ncbi:MAG: YegS/Rv2252/BmrU family lipid kinase [Ruminococcus sp.]|jgi:YegS/Rv2252/BmrU family lipid kinase|nr:YegS/Rv2252/BmrU family lipid kinase [Ruminococcus sp.]
MKKLLLIYNPTAGKGQIKLHLFDIIKILAESGYEVTVHPTAEPLDAYNTAENAENFDIIAASGGDGTLNEIIRGLMYRRERGETIPPLGYIPAGTMNDFASCHNIPLNMTQAAENIVFGEPRPIDIGCFFEAVYSHKSPDFINRGNFTYVAAFGAFVNVSFETSRTMKNTFGILAYLAKAVSAIGQIKPYSVKINAVIEDGEFTIEDEFFFGMVANSTSVGGIKGLTGDNVKLDDGLFECVFVRSCPPSESGMLITALMNRDLSNKNLFLTFKAYDIRMIFGENIPEWTLDGERGGAYNAVRIENARQAVSLIE